MKTTTEYEASDIDLQDPLNGALMAGALITLLTMSGVKERAAKAGKPVDGANMEALKESVASIRNSIEAAGYSIVKREEVPSLFRS